MARILVIEDDPIACQLLRDWLDSQLHVVDVAYTGADGYELALSNCYDLLLVDWELPDFSGIEVLDRLRAKQQDAPVLILTGRRSIDEKEIGFGAGADDYLTKPFELRELTLRIQALLKRPRSLRADQLRVGELCLDLHRRSVEYAGQAVSLMPKEFIVLEFLMRHPNQIFSADALLKHAWNFETDASEGAVRIVIARLRSKLGKDKCPIQTVHGSGYMLIR